MGIAIAGAGIDLATEAAAAGEALSDAERMILGGPALYLTAMAFLRSAGADQITDRVVLVRLGTAVAFIVIWLAGGPLSSQAVAVLMAAVAIAVGIAIGRAWRLLGPAAT